MSTVIRVENLSKQYRLGTIGTGTLSHDINRWWHRVRGKEDPYLKIGNVNDRTQKEGTGDYVWALRDINFEVKAGEVLGVIGRNGAGKSTLLKILSRTTLPTTGSVKVKGRIASLLEVGTGFHPELTGRENIFLNGAILGMRKAEIKNKLDEIVDFAGVGKYVDTPVKRYSSGMYVRLAFAVAAHLDPEILIVDEVLAVGDAEFQKKCLGKMKDVSVKDGRTVLFVSHNIAAVKNLCDTCLLMDRGLIMMNDKTQTVINKYFEGSFSLSSNYVHKAGQNKIKIYDVLVNGTKSCLLKIYENIEFEIKYDLINQINDERIEFFILLTNEEGEFITGFFEADNNKYSHPDELTGIKKFKTQCNLVPGKYYISVGILDTKNEFHDWVEYCENFIVEEFYSDNRIYRQRLGLTIGNGIWEIGKNENPLHRR